MGSELPALTVGGLFDGVGLLAYGLHLAGLEHRWLCEIDPWRRSILEKRFPGTPVLDDVRAAGAVRCERVDVIVGGFPCKGASTAGKRNGFDHPETVLWREMRRAIGELEPRYVAIENVANLLALHDGAVWGEVLGDLAALGFDVVWDCLPAAAVGAPHLRDRVFAVATHADRMAWAPTVSCAGGRGTLAEPSTVERTQRLHGAPTPAADAVRSRLEAREGIQGPAADDTGRGVSVDWGRYEPGIRRWETIHGPAPEPLVRRVDDRGAARVERSRLSALGDGVQVQLGAIVGAYIVELERQRMNIEPKEIAA